MAVTLDGIDIETVTGIIRSTRQQISTKGLGVYGLSLSPNLKGTQQTYDVTGVWNNGNTDYSAKLLKLLAIQDAGLPVWLDATDWQTNCRIFGKIVNLTSTLREGAVGVDDFQFQIIATPSIGYCFIQDSGAGLGKLYGTLSTITRVKSDTFNPLLQYSAYTISSTQMVFSFVIANVGATGSIVIEFMVPDDLTSTASISNNGSGWTDAVGVVGTTGFSSASGTRRRATMTKTMTGATSETLQITLDYTSIKASYLDGSIDEILV